MNILVISLRRSVERRQRMRSQLSHLGLDFEFLDAVDGKTGEYAAVGKFRPGLASRYGGALTPGEAACFVSHALAWQRCVSSGQPLVILEDNAELSADLPAALLAANAIIGSRFGFVRLCGVVPRRFRQIAVLDERFRLVRYMRGPSGAQGYVVSPSGASTLLNAASVWQEPLDDYLDRFWLHGLASLAIHPLAISRAEIETTITGRPNLTGFSLFWRRLVRNGDAALRLWYGLRSHLSRAAELQNPRR